MILNISGVNFYIEKTLNKPADLSAKEGGKNVFLLHGFTGSSKDWFNIIPNLSKRFNYYAVDLIGHGNSDSPSEKNFYETDAIVEQVKELISKLSQGKNIILGYSMGGRAALSFSVKYPHLIETLILESSTAGIKDEDGRNERIKKDNDLAEFIENHTMQEFINFWMSMEIFNTLKRFANSKIEEIKRSKYNNNKIGLSNILRGFGTGRMPNYFDVLNELNFKTLLISGDLDEKFTLINKQMKDLFPSAEHAVIKNSGHNTHLETPKSFIDTVNNFLDKL